MTPFSHTSNTHLGSFLPPQAVRLLIRDERRKAFSADPREREEHFERANRWSDMLGAYETLRFGMQLGR